jgi:hypothetical protein
MVNGQLDIDFREHRVVRIRRFLGNPLDTASRPQFAAGVNGKTYLAKTNGPGNPHVVMQEFLAAKLGHTIGLPSPRFSLLSHEDRLYFGSEKATVSHHRFDPGILSKVTNADALYLIVGFDGWIHNRDRHPGNIMTIREGRQQRLTAIDHSHSPLAPGETLMHLIPWSQVSASDLIHPYLHQHLTDRAKIEQAVVRLEAIDDSAVQDCVNSCPDNLLRRDERDLMATFLLSRRDRLRGWLLAPREAQPPQRLTVGQEEEI